MNALREKLTSSRRQRRFSCPTTVRLWPQVETDFLDLCSEFPHLTQTQVFNHLLGDALERIQKINR
jgi:hypothetical protein